MSSAFRKSSRAVCGVCGSALEWRVRTYYRKDLYYDWTLDVRCPACGCPATDEDREKVRAEYDVLVGEAIERAQDLTLRRRVGRRPYMVLSGISNDNDLRGRVFK